MEHNQNSIAGINHQRAVLIKFHDHFLLFTSRYKNLAAVERLFLQLENALVAVAVVERRTL